MLNLPFKFSAYLKLDFRNVLIFKESQMAKDREEISYSLSFPIFVEV